YTIRLVSVGTGGDTTSLVNYVTIQRAVAPAPMVADADFESSNVGPSGQYDSFAYDPTGSAWRFAGSAGIAANGSGFTIGNPNDPEGGQQVAFLQADGSMSQVIDGWSPGNYSIALRAAQRAFSAGGESHSFAVELDGVVIQVISPTTTVYS